MDNIVNLFSGSPNTSNGKADNNSCKIELVDGKFKNNREAKITDDELSILLTLSNQLELSQEETKLINYLILPAKKAEIDSIINELEGRDLDSARTGALRVNRTVSSGILGRPGAGDIVYERKTGKFRGSAASAATFSAKIMSTQSDNCACCSVEPIGKMQRGSRAAAASWSTAAVSRRTSKHGGTP